MRQQLFEDRYATEWDALECWLSRRSASRRARGPAVLEDAQVPQRYRRLCHQLALARDRRYGAQLIERLHRLANEIHQVLYGARSGDRSRWLGYFYGGFARIVRSEWRVVIAATVLFGVPFLGMTLLAALRPEAAFYVLPAEQISQFEEMYGAGAARLGRRGAETDFAMFGFYIFNNVRIAFQMFAGGLLFGAGALFFLLFNGVVLGTVSGFVTSAGLGVAFYSFVAGHSALELTGLVLAGAAGLKLGVALVAPGRRTRTQALVDAGRAAAGIMYGAAAMLFAAAFVEAFWSPRSEIDPVIKYAAGILGWILVVGYFLFAGRNRGA